MCTISIPRIYSVLVTLLLVCCIAPAQTANTGAIPGPLYDPSGAVVLGAEVVIKSEGQQYDRNLATAAGGEFSVPLLNPDNYEIAIRAQATFQ